MFDRSVPDDHFRTGESVWAVHEGRVRRGTVTGIIRDPDTNAQVQFSDRTLHWFSIGELFKRPTEYHLLRAAVDELVETLQRDCRDLLVESGS